MNLYQAITKSTRRSAPLALDDWASYFTFDGMQYPFTLNQTLVGKEEQIGQDFVGLVQGAYKSNGPVFACMLARLMAFRQARFQFRRYGSAHPGELFGNQDLAVLEKPWPNGTTSDLLARTIQDADIAGNFFATRRADRITRLRPDWVTIVSGSMTDPQVGAWDIDAEFLGLVYKPGGPASDSEPEFLPADLVAHFAPHPDPIAPWRGMSWLTPVIREIMGDKATTTHKLKFFENGATANMVVSLDANITPDEFNAWIEIFSEKHEGVANAYKTLYLGGGANVDVVGADLQQLDFKATQGAGESRIAAASGVGSVIAQFSEGMEGSSLNAGNYGASRRRFADLTIHPLWDSVSGSFTNLVKVPSEAELWYDVRGIPFLQEDAKDDAEIRGKEATTIRQLVDAGFTPESVIEAVTSGDYSLLEHTGLFSVQLQPPNSSDSLADPGRALAEIVKPFLDQGES